MTRSWQCKSDGEEHWRQRAWPVQRPWTGNGLVSEEQQQPAVLEGSVGCREKSMGAEQGRG